MTANQSIISNHSTNTAPDEDFLSRSLPKTDMYSRLDVQIILAAVETVVGTTQIEE